MNPYAILPLPNADIGVGAGTRMRRAGSAIGFGGASRIGSRVSLARRLGGSTP